MRTITRRFARSATLLTAFCFAAVLGMGGPASATTVGTDSVSSCPDGYFCIWSSVGAPGEPIVRVTGGGWHDLRGYAGPFRAMYNHRNKAAFVHQTNQNPPEFCMDDQDYISNVNTAYLHAAWVYLAFSQDFC